MGRGKHGDRKKLDEDGEHVPTRDGMSVKSWKDKRNDDRTRDAKDEYKPPSP